MAGGGGGTTPTYLARDTALLNVPLEPDTDVSPLEAVPPDARGVQRAWSLHGGLLTALSKRVGIDTAAAVAVLCVESGGAGFAPDGRMIIRFENHVFRREWGGRTFDQHFRFNPRQAWQGHEFRPAADAPWRPFHGKQALEWEVFEFARRRNRAAAMRSISMGAPQIMGFNHARIGYPSVEEMFDRFSRDVRFQIIGLFDFMAGGASDSAMLAALRAREFGRFATGYNGPGQAPIYGELIARHVELFSRLPRMQTSRPPRRAAMAAATAAAADAGAGNHATNPHAADAAGTTAPVEVRPARTYVVRSGDTLSAIAGRYGVRFAAIMEANGIANPDRIRAGQVLQIPEAVAPLPPPVPPGHDLPTDLHEDPPAATLRTYRIQRGDTLGAIARRFGVTARALAQANEISNPDRISVGRDLRIPD